MRERCGWSWGVDPKAFRPNSLLHCNIEMLNALCKEKYASLLSMCWKNRQIRNPAGIALHQIEAAGPVNCRLDRGGRPETTPDVLSAFAAKPQDVEVRYRS